MQIYINTDHVISTVAVPCSNFGKIHIVILTIQVNTEIIKNDEIELFLT